LSEDEAFMLLATDNAQGELSPLEIGMHALHFVEDGQGKKGEGITAYAKEIGRTRQFISQCRQAAEVASQLAKWDLRLLSKTQQLFSLHSLPKPTWQEAVQAMLNGDWSAAKTKQRVKDAKEGETDKQKLALLTGKATKKQLDRIQEVYEATLESIETERLKEEWSAWFKESDPVNIRELQEKRIEIEDKDAESRQVDIEAPPSLVLADPPWRYDQATENRKIENQYPSADVPEIISHCPQTAPDCVLLMWATAPKLTEAFEVIEGWGFSYKTSAVWDKEKLGMGYWFRGQHELLLVGVKGNAKPPEPEHRVSSVFREARGEHSKKPSCVYEWIEEAFPGSKLEMYCRSPRAGWQVFGNES
jgi:N6-adenosine-specific RNA methylase IME4